MFSWVWGKPWCSPFDHLSGWPISGKIKSKLKRDWLPMYGDANLHLLNKTNPNFKSRVKEALFYNIIQAWHGPGFDPNLGATPVQAVLYSHRESLRKYSKTEQWSTKNVSHAKCSKCDKSIHSILFSLLSISAIIAIGFHYTFIIMNLPHFLLGIVYDYQ